MIETYLNDDLESFCSLLPAWRGFNHHKEEAFLRYCAHEGIIPNTHIY